MARIEGRNALKLAAPTEGWTRLPTEAVPAQEPEQAELCLVKRTKPTFICTSITETPSSRCRLIVSIAAPTASSPLPNCDSL